MELIALLLMGGLTAAIGGVGLAAVQGGDGDDTLSGDGDDTVRGGAGSDFITLSDDAIGNGGAGHDTLELSDNAVGRGWTGRDFLTADDDATGIGGHGSDTLIGNDDSQVYGGTGRDLLVLGDDAEGWGGNGADVLDAYDQSVGHGGAGADTLSATGDATVHGDAGNDVLQGDRLNGLLDGGDGDDTLTVLGHATATGGAGADLFQVNGAAVPANTATPETVITDFDSGVDRLLVSGSLVSDLQITQDGADTLITVTNHNSLEPTNPGYDRIIRLVGVDGLAEGDLAMSDPAFDAALDPDIRGDGADTAALGADPTFLLTQGGADLVIMSGGGTHEVATFDGNDTVTGEGAGLVRTGEGDDVITLDNGAAGAVTVYGGGGEDTIRVDATDSSLIVLEDEPYGQDAADDLTLFVDADNIGDGPATIIYVNPSSSDTIEIQIDAALTGLVSWVDYVNHTGDYVAIEVGGVEVARIPGSATEWQNNPNLTITRGVVF